MNKIVIKSFLFLSIINIVLVGCGKSDIKTITILASSEVTGSLQPVVEKYQELNNNIQFDIIGAKSIENLDTVLTAKIAANDIPDIFITQVKTDILSYAADGISIPLTSLNLDNRLIKGDHSLLKYSNEYYALPLSLSTSGILINKDTLKKYNISLEPIPQSRDELVEFAKKIQNAGLESPIVIGGKEASPATAFVFQYIYQNVYGKDPNWYANVLRGKTGWNGPEFSKVFDAYGSLVPFINKDVAGLDNTGAVKRFITGEAAMIIDTNSAVRRNRESVPDLDMILIPPPFADTPENMRATVNFDNALQLSSQSIHKDIALNFVEFLLEPENFKLYLQDNKGTLSPLRDVKIVNDPAIEYLANLLAEGVPTAPFLSRQWIPGIKAVMKKGVQDWLTSGKDTKEVLDTIEAEHQRLMKANPDFVKSFLDNYVDRDSF